MTISITGPVVPFVDLSIQHAEVAVDVAVGFERVFASGAYVLGPDVANFEKAFAEYCSVEQCVGVANGTDAIELALRSTGVGRGDEVIVPANTFVATAGAVVRCGAVPVFVDCDPIHLLIDPGKIEERITQRTKAILPVHLYGQLAPMRPVVEIAARRGLVVVEDAAQAQGAEQDGRKIGSWGRAAATSFYPGKNLGAYGDGGAVLTNDLEVAASVRRLRNHGGVAKYEHSSIGFNSRLDALQAVVLLAKLERLNRWNADRRAASERYAELLGDLPSVVAPSSASGNQHVWHLYVIQVPNREHVVSLLNKCNVAAGIHYPVPVHLNEAYSHLGYRRGDFPVAEASADRILSLPLYPGIGPEQQDWVVSRLRAALGSS